MQNSLEQSEEKKRWPLAVTCAFLVVLIASFMPWGTINYHYTEGFMAVMEHPGLRNHILTDDEWAGPGQYCPIQLVHLQDNLLHNEREVDWLALDPLGRLSGKRYCAVRKIIESDN